MKRWMGCLVAVLCLMVLVPGRALAQEEEGTTGPRVGGETSSLNDMGPHTRSSMLSVFALLSWGNGLGVAGRYTLPVMHDGFIDTINDSVELEFGADVSFSSYSVLGFNYGYTNLVIPLEGRWSFHLNPKLSLYGKLSLGWYINFWTGDIEGVQGLNYSGIYLSGGAGALYALSDTFWLRGELGATGAKLGVGFNF